MNTVPQTTVMASPLAADGLPKQGIDRSTTITINLGTLALKAAVFTDDTPEAGQTIAVWVDGPTDGTDLTADDAEQALAALPAFTEQFRALTASLAGGTR